MPRSLPLLMLAAALAAWSPSPLCAQYIDGRLLRAGDRVPLPGVRVTLLDEGHRTRGSAVTGEEGGFVLEAPAAGRYLLVAERDGFASAVSEPVEVDEEETVAYEMSVELVPVAADGASGGAAAEAVARTLAASCQGAMQHAREGILVGVVRDSMTGVPLADVATALERVDPGGRVIEVASTRSGAEGMFLFCGVPPDPLYLRAAAGRKEGGVAVHVRAGTIRKQDLTLALSDQTEPADIRGRVTAWDTGEPVAGADVVLEGTGHRAVTDEHGRFALRAVPYGIYVLRVDHLAYEAQEKAFRLEGGTAAEIDVSLASEAVTLDPITVTVRPRRFFGDMAELDRRMDAGFGLFVTREDIETRGITPGTPLSQALRGLPGVKVLQKGIRHEVQLQGAYSLSGGACAPVLYLDGSKYSVDPTWGFNETFGDLEAIEIYRGPAEVPAEFSGSDAGCGVIVVWTRR